MHREQEKPEWILRFQHQGAGVSFSFQDLLLLKHQTRQWQKMNVLRGKENEKSWASVSWDLLCRCKQLDASKQSVLYS